MSELNPLANIPSAIPYYEGDDFFASDFIDDFHDMERRLDDEVWDSYVQSIWDDREDAELRRLEDEQWKIFYAMEDAAIAAENEIAAYKPYEDMEDLILHKYPSVHPRNSLFVYRHGMKRKH